MGHHESLPLGHTHFAEPEQVYHSAKFGMWVFLATEVHLFGALFCTFAVYRWRYFEDFQQFALSLNWRLGGLNTLVLLTSSYFMVRAVDAAQKGLNKKVNSFCNLTLICALIFLVVKFFEYRAKLVLHEPPIFPHSHIFYGLYFTMTGIHGLHVLLGMGAIWWLKMRAKREEFSVTYYTPVEVVGLYWHLVDVVWIYLFPLLYLLGGLA